MTRIIGLLMSCVLCFAGCSNAGTTISKDSSNSASSATQNESNTSTPGLSKVGELPLTDRPDFSIDCVNEQVCWLSTQKILWQSVDGGKNWQEIYHTPGDELILGYHFTNAAVGWSFSFSRLYKTEDGGRTWIHESSPLEGPNGEIRSLYFLADGKSGWLAGGLYRDQTKEELKFGVPNNTKDVTGKRVLVEAIFHTADGGKTWQKSLNDGVWGRIRRIQFANEKQGIALGNLAIYRSNDGGVTWNSSELNKSCVRREYVEQDYAISPLTLAMLDFKVIWIGYEDGGVIRSVDGGRHWCDVMSPEQMATKEAGWELFTAMHFDNAEHGWALGDNRFLYETTDGGKTWSRVNSEIRFHDMKFIGLGRAFLVSDKDVYNLIR
ncbi:MAG TPA: hypothetical protein VGD61_03925 [Pyrinomonadaceae bacterium]